MTRLILFVVLLLPLLGCQSVPNPSSYKTSEEISQTQSCEQIAQQIDRMDKILESQSPSETQELMKNAAVSAAQTGISASGVLGSAGTFVGLGVNFARRLYGINAKERQEKIKDAAQMEKNVFVDAYYYKQCM